jgi:hypothetical protein
LLVAVFLFVAVVLLNCFLSIYNALPLSSPSHVGVGNALLNTVQHCNTVAYMNHT